MGKVRSEGRGKEGDWGWVAGGGEDEGMLALKGGTCCRRRRGDVGGRGAVGGAGKWGVTRGRGRGWH